MQFPSPSSSQETIDKLISQSADKNKEFIQGVLRGYLPETAQETKVLEIASGFGKHVTFYAADLPHVTWQPSDIEDRYLESIRGNIKDKGVKNVLEPVYLDMMKPPTDNLSLLPESFDLMLNINMVHTSPWEAAKGLFLTAKKFLKPSGVLFMYGPFSIDGSLTPESNVKFDAWLRARNPAHGVRDTGDLKKLGIENGLLFEKMVDMPSNNKCLVFRKNA